MWSEESRLRLRGHYRKIERFQASVSFTLSTSITDLM